MKPRPTLSLVQPFRAIVGFIIPSVLNFSMKFQA